MLPTDKTIRNNLAGFIVGTAATLLSYGIAGVFHLMDFSQWGMLTSLEAVAVLTSYWSTYLCVVQDRTNYFFGFISTILYSILFYNYGLYGSMLVNIYLPFALVYGYIRWGANGNPRPVTLTSTKTWIVVYIPITIISAALIAFAFGFFNIPAPPTSDIAILVLTILAQWLLDNKKLETWLAWALVNVSALYTYGSQGLWLVVFQYLLFLANTVYGYTEWNKSRKAWQSKRIIECATVL